MEITAPMPLGGEPSRFETEALRADHRALAPSPRRAHALEFTGSGSEYFRIWIVNLLLTVLTLGIYYPWAAVRKRRYFYGNTLLDGHAFDFHGDPKRMLRGYLLIVLLAFLYGFAGQISPIAGVIAVVAVAILWPALFRAAQQFRMANTSWRGLRFHFSGSLGGAYLALLPLLAPPFLVGFAAALMPEPTPGAAAFLGLAMLLVIGLAVPLTGWLLKRYQHGHYGLGEHTTRFASGPGPFFGLAFKTGLVALGVAILAGMLFGVVFWFGRTGGPATIAVSAMVVGLAFYGAMFVIVQPYALSRLQNLVWSRTESRPMVRITSALRFGPAARLALKNVSLMIVTLGLYWPFAAIANARLRLEAVSVQFRHGSDAFAADAAARQHSAAGDAAGDVFGLDVGL